MGWIAGSWEGKRNRNGEIYSSYLYNSSLWVIFSSILVDFDFLAGGGLKLQEEIILSRFMVGA